MAPMNQKELQALEQTAARVAQNAGKLLLTYANGRFQTRQKSRFDLVTSADLASNALIRKQLLEAFPDSLVLAEEDAVSTKKFMKEAADCEVVWIADPLDGTSNFSKRVPHYAVSIGAYNPRTKEILAACIYDPSRDESFVAAKGLGAKLNGKKIKASSVDKLSQALAATGFAYKRDDDDNLAEHVPFVKKCLGVRRFGAAALDLAWIACGRFDLYWEPGLQPWDVCAGILIVREAGGAALAYSGEPSSPFDSAIIATNSHLSNVTLKHIRRARKDAGLKV